MWVHESLRNIPYYTCVLLLYIYYIALIYFTTQHFHLEVMLYFVSSTFLFLALSKQLLPFETKIIEYPNKTVKWTKRQVKVLFQHKQKKWIENCSYVGVRLLRGLHAVLLSVNFINVCSNVFPALLSWFSLLLLSPPLNSPPLKQYTKKWCITTFI